MRRHPVIFLIITALFLGAVFYFQKKTELPVEISESPSEEASAVKNKKSSLPSVVSPAKTSHSKSEKTVIDFSEELDALPTFDDMKELSEEDVHHTPEIVREGGRVIGRMIEKAEQHPELREKSVVFFLDCAQNNELVNSIRAVCWKSTLTQMKKWNIFVPLADVKIPPRVLELSSQLP